MALNNLGSLTLADVNIGLLAALGLLNPLALQIDLFVNAQLGLGPLLADLEIQLNAAFAAFAAVGLQVSFPFFAVNALLAVLANLTATIQAAIALGLPSVSLTLSAQLTALADLIGFLEFRIGGIRALIEAGVGLKIPALELIAQMNATLTAKVHLISFTGDFLINTGADIAALFAAGLGPPDYIDPFEVCHGVLMVTNDIGAYGSLSAIIKTS
mgnify:CR=1 FL=1